MTDIPPPPPPPSGAVPPPPPGAMPPAAGAPKSNNGKALTSMILGIVSIALCLYWFLAIPSAIVGLILALIGKKEIAQGKGTNKGMATTGLITSIIGIVLGLILVILAFAGSGLGDYCLDNSDSVFCTGQ